MLKDIFYQFNPWWEGNFETDLLTRPRYLNDLSQSLSRRSIEFISGLRRIGKTALIKLLIKKLLNQTQANKILYISLDAYGLENYSLHDILTDFRKIHKHNRSEFLYLFFDEITAQKSYNQELKNFYDNENVKIFASASQAGLMKDRSALLTGRTRLHEILPLTFDEFIRFRKIEIKPSESYLAEQYFIEYMKTGGIPEYVLTDDIGYLEELCDNLIYKDIIAYYGVKDNMLIRDFFKLLMERCGKQVSITKIANILGISPDTSRRYFNYFQNTYLIHPIERCGKLNERIRSGKKVYAGDVGIRNMITGFRDKGAVFENLIFFKIKQHNPCYVYKNGNEIDFKTETMLIESKFNSSMTNNQRKIFDHIPAVKKLVIDSVNGFLELEQYLDIE